VAEVHQFALLQVGVQLYLETRGRKSGGFEDRLDLGDVVIGQADASGATGVQLCLHFLQNGGFEFVGAWGMGWLPSISRRGQFWARETDVLVRLLGVNYYSPIWPPLGSGPGTNRRSLVGDWTEIVV
jgi:hypothetical protein